MSRPPEIILCALGTKGDILPFLALASELKRRSHGVTILSNSNWGPLARDVGARFVTIGPPDPTQSGRDDFAFFLNNALPAHRRTFDFVAETVRNDHRTILVYQPFMLGAECAALRFGLPNIKMVLQPLAIRSMERPPWPLTPLAQGRFGAISKRTIIPLLCAISETAGNSRRYRRRSNAFRRSLGLPAVRGSRLGSGPEDMTLLMSPRWFAMPQRDWPGECHSVGFPFFDQPIPDAALDGFIHHYGAPLVFTPGTGVVDAADFFARAQRVCALLNIPGILLSPLAPTTDETSFPHVARRDYVALEWLVPRARMLVHHGGIGTTAQAIRAGIPQIIFPDRFDQPDNAVRVAQLRLGAAIMSEKIAPRAWADLIHKMLADECMRRRLALASKATKMEDAARNAADHIEDLAERRLGLSGDHYRAGGVHPSCGGAARVR